MFTLLVLSEPCRFFQHPYHFHPCSDYLAEGPSTGKNVCSARMKFGTDRLFTLQILSEPNPFFGTLTIFTRAVPKIFCSVNRDVIASSPSFSHPAPESPGELAVEKHLRRSAWIVSQFSVLFTNFHFFSAARKNRILLRFSQTCEL